jgi:hypothetical protein
MRNAVCRLAYLNVLDAAAASLNVLDVAAVSLAGRRSGGGDETSSDVEATEMPLAVAVEYVRRRRRRCGCGGVAFVADERGQMNLTWRRLGRRWLWRRSQRDGRVSARLGGGRVARGCAGVVSEAAASLLHLEAAGSPVAAPA